MKKPTPVSLTTTLPCAGILLGLLVATSACQPAGAETTTAPTTPAPQSTIYRCGNINETCSKVDFDKFEEQRKLAEQAEQIYREIQSERSRLSSSPSYSGPTEVLLDRTADPYLKMITALLESQAQRDVRSEGTVQVRDVRLVTPPHDGALVTLRSCEDSTGVRVFKGGAETGRGLILEAVTDFKMIDGKLKAFDGSARQVGQCGE